MAAEILILMILTFMLSLLSTCAHFRQLVGYTSTAVHLRHGCFEPYAKRKSQLVGLCDLTESLRLTPTCCPALTCLSVMHVIRPNVSRAYVLALMVTKGTCPCRAIVLCHHASCFTKYTNVDLLHISLSDIAVVVNVIGNLSNVIQSAMSYEQCRTVCQNNKVCCHTIVTW